MDSKSKLYPDQIIPLVLTTVVCGLGIFLLYLEIYYFNLILNTSQKISLILRWPDILVGLTIYLKTSIDFAIFIGRLMNNYPGWKNRVMIEIGTALGNILGTLLILVLWAVFKEVKVLMFIMILIASLVLFRMAEDGFRHANSLFFEKILKKFNSIFDPILDKIIPHQEMKTEVSNNYKALFFLAFSVPFILGLDDFAGYIPLFSVINVFGFATGVFLGHMILNIALFISPTTTIKLVKNKYISIVGAFVFVGLGVWGILESIKLIF